MLPDLWRLAHRRAHVHRLPADPPAPRLRAGLDHHATTDRWFHESAALHRGEGALREVIRSAGLRAPKLSLLAHPLWEMCLDGALARQVGATELRSELRASFAEASGERAVCEGALGEALGADGEVFTARLGRVTRELLEGPWIDAYTHGDGLAFCLDGMRLRTGLPRLDPDERARLALGLQGLAGLADELLTTM